MPLHIAGYNMYRASLGHNTNRNNKNTDLRAEAIYQHLQNRVLSERNVAMEQELKRKADEENNRDSRSLLFETFK